MDILSRIDWSPFWLSIKLASITTILLFIVALPLAWRLSQTRCGCKPIIEALVAMPLVLPPSVLGFYLLVAFAPESLLGGFVKELFGVELVFSFPGLVVASMIYSLPFMVQPLQSGFEAIPKNIIEASFLAGKGWLQTLIFVILPNMKASLLSALIISFAHTIGEFGVVLIVGGSIPNQTKVASIAIYEYVETLDFASAHIYSAIMVAMSFAVLFTVYYINRKNANKNL